MIRTKIIAVAAAGALAAGVVPAASAATLDVVHLNAAKSGLRYTQTVLRARAGTIRIIFRNPSSLKHNVNVELGEKELGHSATVTKATTSFTVKLKAGKYNYYCSVPGHEDAGMHGTLIVS